MVTRIDYMSKDGRRQAVVQRIEEHHVPPLGVTWWVSRKAGSQDELAEAFTKRSVAEDCARKWVTR